MRTFLSINIAAPSKDEAVDILADVLLKIEKHEFQEPHNNDCGDWFFKWSNIPKDENEGEDE